MKNICGEKICRLCATEIQNFVRIFEDTANDSETPKLSTVGEMMLDCLFSDITADSGYPEIVCQMCSLQLNVFYEFKKKVLVHHKHFTTLIEESKPSSEPSIKPYVSPRIQIKANSPKDVSPPPIIAKIEKLPAKFEDDEKEEEEEDIQHEHPQQCTLIKQTQPPKLLNKSPVAVPAKLQQHQKKMIIKPELLDEKEEHEDESYEKIVKYLQEHEEEQLSETSEVFSTKNIKDEFLSESVDDDDVDVDERLEEMSQENVTITDQQDNESEYLEEFYLEEADALEASGGLNEDCKNYDNPDSPTFSAIYLDEEFADQNPVDDDENSNLTVERLDEDFQLDEKLSIASMQSRKRKMQQKSMEEKPKRVKNVMEEQTHVCTACTIVFTKLSKYREHMNSVHKSLVNCDICDLQVKLKDLNTHKRLMHSEEDEDNENLTYNCSICGKVFISLQQCEIHEYRHTNIRPFACTLCDKSFKLKCDLHVHMMCHNDIRKHVCNFCGKGFRMSSHLKTHIDTHVTERTLECDICNQLFKTPTTLKYHKLQVHSWDHKYKCGLCTRGFCKKDKYEKHVLTHSNTERRKKRSKLLIVNEINELNDNELL